MMLPHAAERARSPSDPSGLSQRASSGSDVKHQSLVEDASKKVAMNNELDFSRWYYDIQDELLEASYEDYQYALPTNRYPV
jgi:hypothetical protein